MKKTQSFRLSEKLVHRLENLAAASRIKKGTLIEMCIEKHLPVLEEKYREEIVKLIEDGLAAAGKNYTPHKHKRLEMNETADKKKKSG